MEIYVVQKGDTVDKIASAYGVSKQSIIYNNQISGPDNLAVGQALLIGEVSQGDKPQIFVNGYAYPFISTWVLQETLPYLSTLSVFSYGFTPNGDLVAPQLNDIWMTQSARAAETVPILTLTPFGPDGQFNNMLISNLINNEEAQNNLLGQIAAVMQEKQFGGMDIDFEFILASDRDAFTSFVKKTTQFMNNLGYTVSVALAPKISSEQRGLLYEGKDYQALGAVANAVLLMTYEWGYTYGPPMAVAPVNKVREVIEYAVTQIPQNKIDMGIPNYGYDWTLPYIQGVTKARTIGNVEAVQIAVREGAQIQFDEESQSPYFNYNKGNVQHEVWFEDVRSLQAKFNLIKEFGLRGAGYWQIMRLFRANWLLLAENFNKGYTLKRQTGQKNI